MFNYVLTTHIYILFKWFYYHFWLNSKDKTIGFSNPMSADNNKPYKIFIY